MKLKNRRVLRDKRYIGGETTLKDELAKVVYNHELEEGNGVMTFRCTTERFKQVIEVATFIGRKTPTLISWAERAETSDNYAIQVLGRGYVHEYLSHTEYPNFAEFMFCAKWHTGRYSSPEKCCGISQQSLVRCNQALYFAMLELDNDRLVEGMYLNVTPYMGLTE